MTIVGSSLETIRPPRLGGAEPTPTTGWVVAGATGALVATLGARPQLLILLIAGIVACVLLTAIARRPVVAARSMVVAGPLLVGMERGAVAGPLRPNEIVLALVTLGVIGALLLGRLRLPAWRGCDTAIASLAVTGVLLPLLVAFGRGRGPTFDDVLSTFTLVKGVVLYAIFRVVHRSPKSVWKTARLSIVVASLVATIGILDAFDIGGTTAHLARFFPSNVGPVVDDTRGSSTIGNPIGLGGYLVVNLALAVPLLRASEAPVKLHRVHGLVLLLGIIATGQISAWLAASAMTLAALIVDRPRVSSRTILMAIGAVVLAVTVLLPVAGRRAEGFAEQAVPTWKLREIAELDAHEQPQALYYASPGSSWDVRRYNLETYFLPDLREPGNILLGVRPEARVVPREPWLEYVWIESGALWLVYVGGLPLVAAFGFVLLRFFSSARARSADVEGRPFAFCAVSIVAALGVLMLFDPHLTMRGTSDALYPILGLCAVAFGWAETTSVRRGSTGVRLAPVSAIRPKPATGGFGDAVKRMTDISGALTLIVVLSPILVAAAVLVRRTSEGATIYRQERIGRNGEPFEILKFRSMSVDNDDHEHREYASRLLADPAAESGTTDGIYKLEDPRVTSVGRHLRRYSIDELPQLWNVLRGDMSLVGPRPMLDWEVALLDESARRRLAVKPGCTGLWQVSGRSRLSTHQMLQADVVYVERWTPSLDFRILLRTPRAIWGGDGTR